ncbi:unnamed protein product [Ilex paraguariensis]|uniref:RING-type domain-containing protein n=1 Tax=Ilex paraguariensis TaxID=185542 RepID=A0ABC8R5D4_9AQUA
MLYGFHNDPPLDVVNTWSETHATSLHASSHQEWLHFLNEGSQINVSYSVSPSSSSLVFVIVQGKDGLAEWLEEPSYPNSALLWEIIHGNGMIQLAISKSSSYYIAVANLYAEEVDVQLNLTIKALLYNTTEAYYMCTFAHGQCTVELIFPTGNIAILTSPGPRNRSTKDEWYVKLSYGPRWISYLVGIGGLTVVMLLAFHFSNNFQCTSDNMTGTQYGDMGSERAPLLSRKDDDISSWGSSYDSVSQDDEDPEDALAVTSLEGKPTKVGEYNNNTRRLCAICYDGPRDCFFLPCGHCVACFACGTRIAEAAGTCPICRREMKKVRKIFTV